MTTRFDPVRRRDVMLTFKFEGMARFRPDEVSEAAICSHVSTCMHSLAECYWLGLADMAEPQIRAIVSFMESRNPPAINNWPGNSPRIAYDWHYFWWRSLGLAKWLLGVPSPEAALVRGLAVEMQCLQHPVLEDAEADRASRQDNLDKQLVDSLAANAPLFGLQFLEAVGVPEPVGDTKHILDFGRWACRHLARGGLRDQQFIGRGESMLRASLLDFYFPQARWLEPALWLKAIYFDSGVTRTAEETILRAYDCMPGVPRPDFLPK